MQNNRLALALVMGVWALMAPGAAFGALMLQSFNPFSGTGLGSVNTVLTLQSPGNSTTETGCVAFTGTTDVFTCAGFPNAQVMTGANQTRTLTLAQIGAATASDIRIVFNAAQPGGGPITLTGLVLTFYNASGGVAFQSSGLKDVGGNPVTSIVFPNTETGVGNSGFVFRLDAAQAAAAQAALGTTVRVGLAASATNASGGLETFFFANANLIGGGGGGGAAVPEPSTWVILGTGLALAAIRPLRRRVR